MSDRNLPAMRRTNRMALVRGIALAAVLGALCWGLIIWGLSYVL